MTKPGSFDVTGARNPVVFGSDRWDAYDSMGKNATRRVVILGHALESSTGEGRVPRLVWKEIAEKGQRFSENDDICRLLERFAGVDDYDVMMARLLECPELVGILDSSCRKILELFDAPRLYLEESPVVENGGECEIVLAISPREDPDHAFDKMMELDDWWLAKSGALWDRIIAMVQYRDVF